MKMEEYIVTDKNKIDIKSGTNGYQPKYTYNNKFLKVQANIGGYYVNDWMVEVIASKLGKQLGLSIVMQEPCIIHENRGNIGRYGVSSNNFETDGIHFISLKRLLGDEWPNINYNKLSINEKINYIAKCVNKTTGIKYNTYLKYLVDTLIIDLLVCNIDRHLRNLGVLYDQYKNYYSIAPIFDCGMGLFVHDPKLYEYTHGNLELMIDTCYIEPYSESPIDLAKYLKSNELYKKYLSNLRSKLGKRGLVALEAWFPTKQSHEYFKIIRKELGLC